VRRRDVVSSTRAARTAASDNVLTPPIGLVVAELDQATPLAGRLNGVIRQAVAVPSVAHKSARQARDVHDISVSMFPLLRPKMLNLIRGAASEATARRRLTKESRRPGSGPGSLPGWSGQGWPQAITK
jgi:hypothetical protein